MDNVIIFGYTDNWFEPTPNKMNYVIQRWKNKLEMCEWNTCLQAYLYLYFHFRILLLNFSVATSKFNEHCSINLEMSSAKHRPFSSSLCVKRLSIKHFKWKRMKICVLDSLVYLNSLSPFIQSIPCIASFTLALRPSDFNENVSYHESQMNTMVVFIASNKDLPQNTTRHNHLTPAIIMSKYIVTIDNHSIVSIVAISSHVSPFITWFPNYRTLTHAISNEQIGVNSHFTYITFQDPCTRFPVRRVLMWLAGGRLNKKDGLTRYGNSHVKDKTSWRPSYL